MNDDDLDRVLRAGLPAYDQDGDRVAAVRAQAHAELRHASRRLQRGWGWFEATASLTVAAAQLVWVLSTFLGR